MASFRLWLVGISFSAASLMALDTTTELQNARRLIGSGHLEEAERLVRRNLRQGEETALHLTLGDILFRQGDFAGAERAYRAALSINDLCARAWWGLGRIELAQFHRRNAREFLTKAFGLDPQDPDIIVSYLEFANDPHSRAVLLENVVTLTRKTDLQRAEESLGQLELEKRLNGQRSERLASPYRAYTIRLSTFQPAGPKTDGMLVPVTINGGRTLRLLLDTGARGITIAAKSARQLNLEPVSESRIGGLGTSGPVTAAVTIARNVAIGDLRLQDCVVEVTRDALTGGADGVMGMNLFEAFEIQLDGRNKMLRLNPFPEGLPSVADSAPVSAWASYDRGVMAEKSASVPAYGFRHFLLVRTTVNGKEGLFLVDTGSAVTTLARDFVPEAGAITGGASFRGAGGEVADVRRISPVTLQIAGRTFVDRDPVAMNLEEMSRRQGVRISGILGYPALSQSAVTFNYRDGLVDLGARH